MDALAGFPDRRQEFLQNRRRCTFPTVSVSHPTALTSPSIIRRISFLPVIGRIAHTDKHPGILLDLLGAGPFFGELCLQQLGRKIRRLIGRLQRIREIHPRSRVRDIGALEPLGQTQVRHGIRPDQDFEGVQTVSQAAQLPGYGSRT